MDRRAAPGGDGGGGMDAGDAAAGPDDVLSRDSEVGSWVGVSHGFDVCLCFDALCIVRCSLHITSNLGVRHQSIFLVVVYDTFSSS